MNNEDCKTGGLGVVQGKYLESSGRLKGGKGDPYLKLVCTLMTDTQQGA